MSQNEQPDFAKGALAGIAGGLIASYAMNRFQAALARVNSNGAHSDRSDEAVTMKVADALSEKLLARPLQPDQKDPAANFVHYAFGAAVGGFYGALAETAPASQVGYGTVFGTVLWFLADEVAAPRFGLSKAATEYPASVHVSAWASHLVYGITTDLLRRGLRAL